MVTLNQIGQIAITVKDLPRAVAFYRDVLGMRHLFDAGPKLSFFDCGGVRLMLDIPEQAIVNAIEHRLGPESVSQWRLWRRDYVSMYESMGAKL